MGVKSINFKKTYAHVKAWLTEHFPYNLAPRTSSWFFETFTPLCPRRNWYGKLNIFCPFREKSLESILFYHCLLHQNKIIIAKYFWGWIVRYNISSILLLSISKYFCLCIPITGFDIKCWVWQITPQINSQLFVNMNSLLILKHWVV